MAKLDLKESLVQILDAKVRVEKKCKYGDWNLIGEYPIDLLTTNARDLLHAAIIYASSQGPGFSYYAVTNVGTFSPAVGDTTFPSEVTGSGLARHQPTGTGEGVAHTSGQNTSVTTVIFTNNTAGAVTGIKGYANFTTNVSTQPCFELAFTSTDLAVGDSLKLVITYTMG
jgi:hypothetical protein